MRGVDAIAARLGRAAFASASVPALLVGVAVVVAGCASSRSILYKGWVKPGNGQRIVFSDAWSVKHGRSMRKQWLADIARAGRERPKLVFHNLSESRVRARLTAASRDQFTVKRVEFFHPRQAAPLVIIQSRHYLALARVFRTLYGLINPSHRHRRPKEAFEAVFFEAQDERGVPFIIASIENRGPNLHGGVWARSAELFPGPHG